MPSPQLIVAVLGAVVAGSAVSSIAYLRTRAAEPPRSVTTASTSRSAVVFDQTTLRQQIDPEADVYGQQVFADFEFRCQNNGPRDVEIGKITTTCSCTVAAPVQRVLRPGESTTLKVRLGVTATGESAQTARVTLSDSVQPVVLKVVANYEPRWIARAQPDQLTFGERSADSAMMMILIEGAKEPLPDVVGFRSDSGQTTATITNNSKSPARTIGGRFVRWVRISVKRPTHPSDVSRDVLHIDFTDSSRGALSIPVTLSNPG